MRGDHISSCARPVLAALLGMQLIGFACVAPAHAAEDDNVLNSLLGVVGMQFKKQEEVIDYRARPPLVVPPSNDLPPPVPAGTARTADWPNDPDVMARRKAAADSRRPAPQLSADPRAELSKEELMRGRSGGPTRSAATTNSECGATSGTPGCLYTPWDELKAKKESVDDKNIVLGGQEPPRNYLTEPPVGYRKASATVKATRDPAKEKVDPGDAGAYARQQGQHKLSVDD